MKKWLAVLGIVLSLNALPVGVNAETKTVTEETTTQTTDTGYACFTCEYGSGITPAKDDVFVLGVTEQYTGYTTTIELNTYDLSDGVAKVDLPEGGYDIYSIKYNGSNEDIKEQGYAITAYIYASASSPNRVQLCIGEAVATSLMNTYTNVLYSNGYMGSDGLSLDNSASIDYVNPDEELSTDTDATESDARYDYSDVYEADDDDMFGTLTQTPTDAKPITEYYEVEQTDNNTMSDRIASAVRKALLAIVIVIAGGVFLLVRYIKNKD